MKIPKIKTRKEVIITHYVYCPYCDKEIKGTKSQVEYNLKLHLDKHKRGKITKQAIKDTKEMLGIKK